nr:MAG TPA: hypothetical protein [Caudoviricetes sp.]
MKTGRLRRMLSAPHTPMVPRRRFRSFPPSGIW